MERALDVGKTLECLAVLHISVQRRISDGFSFYGVSAETLVTSAAVGPTGSAVPVFRAPCRA